MMFKDKYINKFYAFALAAVFALTLAGCGGGGGGAAAPDPDPPVVDPDPTLAEQLSTAQQAAAAAAAAAMTARDAAMAERDAAQSAFDDLEDKRDNDVPNYTRAMDRLADAEAAYEAAKAAYEAAKAASDAAAAAEATEAGVAEAKRQQAIAETKKAEAEAEKAKAMAANTAVMTFAGHVTAAAEEAGKLADAKSAAMTAADEAEDAADEAEMKADEAEAALPGSPAAMAARAAATAARAAATAARAASMNAQEDTMSADAEAEQTTAEEKRDEAKMKRDEAKTQLTTALNARSGTDQAEIRRYREEAMTAAEEARAAAMKAEDYADKADEAADAAEEDASTAKAERKDYAEANKNAMAARAAADEAQAAADAADAAADAAEAESEKARADGVSVEDALAARNMARAKRTEAEKHRDTAMAHYDSDDEDTMGAKQLAAAAKGAAGMYKLKLLAVASGQGLADAEKKARITLVRNLIEDAGDQLDDQSGTAGAGPSGARLFTLTTDGTGTRDNSISGLIQVDSGGNQLTQNDGWGALVQHPIGKDRVYRFGKYTAEHLRTPDPEATTEQATQRDLPMLGRFTGVELSKDTLAAHIYTDYDPSKRKAAVKAGNISGVQASSGTVSGTFDLSTAGTITTLAGSKFTKDGVTYSGTGVTFACTAPADCSYTSTGAAATATITSLGSGWRVTGSAAAVPEAGDPDYMVFGYWLDLSASSTFDKLGAFAGGNYFEIGAVAVTPLAGTATYRGSAAGLHGMTGAKEAVQPFEAKAELTAKFGTAAELGGVQGRIYDINSGGERLTGEMSEITLAYGEMNADTSRAFSNYNARMGTPTVNPVDNSAEYPINGLWQGRFSFLDAESDDAAKRYPLSAIGTFGVSGTLDMGTADNTKDDVTHSLIGAFGAHLER